MIVRAVLRIVGSAVYPAIDQYLAPRVNARYYRAYVLNPRVATQPELTFCAELDAPLRDLYMIG